MTDHNVCSLRAIFDFCIDAELYLNNTNNHEKDAHPVIAVHCKAGKGRTGLVIACLMIFEGPNKEGEDFD